MATDAYDIHETERGLKAGVAVEGNTFLIPTNRPTTGQLWKRDMVTLSFTLPPSALAFVFHRSDLFYGGLASPGAISLKHVFGARQWAKLIAERR